MGKTNATDSDFSDQEGFTLIELMIVVAILSILAVVGVTQYVNFTKRAKASEATQNLSALFKGAATYYEDERSGRGVGAGAFAAGSVGHCTVGNLGPLPAVPTIDKQQVDFPSTDPGWADIGFSIADGIYFSYEVVSGGARCGNAANNNTVYSFRAHGDLDGDGTASLYELAIGSNGDNNLYHGPGFYIERGTE